MRIDYMVTNSGTSIMASVDETRKRVKRRNEYLCCTPAKIMPTLQATFVIPSR